MSYVRLIHWNETEAEERARQLRALGYKVVSASFNREALRAMSEHPPAALVIDLTRAPSQGRDVAVGVRKGKATRAEALSTSLVLILCRGKHPECREAMYRRMRSQTSGARAEHARLDGVTRTLRYGLRPTQHAGRGCSSLTLPSLDGRGSRGG